jgi:hypothetical protein
VRCCLRELRGERTLLEISTASGVHITELSKIERGFALPRDEWIPGMEQAYGQPVERWYGGGAIVLVLESEGDA